MVIVYSICGVKMSSVINIRVDSETKKQAEKLFNDLGMNMSVAINMFLKQSLLEGCLPFKPGNKNLNLETMQAILEGRELANDPNAIRYKNVDELKQALGL